MNFGPVAIEAASGIATRYLARCRAGAPLSAKPTGMTRSAGRHRPDLQPRHLRRERHDAVRRRRVRGGPERPHRAGDAALHEPGRLSTSPSWFVLLPSDDDLACEVGRTASSHSSGRFELRKTPATRRHEPLHAGAAPPSVPQRQRASAHALHPGDDARPAPYRPTPHQFRSRPHPRRPSPIHDPATPSPTLPPHPVEYGQPPFS